MKKVISAAGARRVVDGTFRANEEFDRQGNDHEQNNWLAKFKNITQQYGLVDAKSNDKIVDIFLTDLDSIAINIALFEIIRDDIQE